MILSLELFPYLIFGDRSPALAIGHLLLALATTTNFSMEGFMTILLNNYSSSPNGL